MSRTPAAHLAHLKVTYQNWTIYRMEEGLVAPLYVAESEDRPAIKRTSIGGLEIALSEAADARKRKPRRHR
jgi:hypothetical protein